MALMSRLVWTAFGRLGTRLVAWARRRRARRGPDFECYVSDLEAAGAEEIVARNDESGPRTLLESSGRRVDLNERTSLEYRLIDEQPSSGKMAIALRLEPG